MSFKVSGVFSNNAVLQRERPVKIWGSSDCAGSIITASFGDFSAEGKVTDAGKWELYLPAMPADVNPRTLEISDGETLITFENVLVGDVYFVNGQSNMEYLLENDFWFEEEKANISPDDNIRLFYQFGPDIRPIDSEILLNPQDEPLHPHYKWYAPYADSQYTRNFSAIGYYCAKKICDKIGKNIPLGFINTNLGGAQMTHLVPAYINEKYGYTNPESLTNYNVYNVLMHPVENYTTCGMLWYQGESECHRPPSFLHYKERFFMLLEYLMEKSANGVDYAVYKFQLCSHSSDPTVGTAGWQVPAFRSFQLDMANDPEAPCKIYLIPTHDHGVKAADSDTAHPKYKKPIAERCANLILETRYNACENAQAPVPCAFEYDPDGVTIKFKNISGGLVLHGDSLLGFETVRGGEASPAKAELIAPDTVRVYAEKPEGVRYAFAQAVSPSIATLYGGSGIPCPTFADKSLAVPRIDFGKMD